MKIENDPFKMVLSIVKKKYPNLKARIFFTQGVPKSITDKDVYGCTIFHPDNKRTPVILIDTSCTVNIATNVLAHELAHVIVGKNTEKNDHGPKWKKTLMWISSQYKKESERIEK